MKIQDIKSFGGWGWGWLANATKNQKNNKNLHNFLITFAAGKYSVFNLDTMTRDQNL